MTASNPEKLTAEQERVDPTTATPHALAPVQTLDVDAIEYWAREEGDGATVAQTIALCEQVRTLLAALDRPTAAWATVLPSGKIHAMRTKKIDADRRTAAWNTDHPRPPLAETVPMALQAAPTTSTLPAPLHPATTAGYRRDIDYARARPQPTPAAVGVVGAPARIYLNLGADLTPPVDFSALDEVCWCKEAQDAHDVEYVRADLAAPTLPRTGAGLPDAVRDALTHYVKLRDHVGGCSDGGCVIQRPVGMHTNGGCRCARDPLKAMRMMWAGQQLAAALLAASAAGADEQAGA